MTPPRLILHHCHGTRSMRTLWLLHELGVPFEVQLYPFDKSLRAPEFLALSPAGRVPALQVDGAVLHESGAMAEYLAERFDGAGLHRAPDHPERAGYLSWLHYAETLSVHVAALTQQHLVIRDPAQQSPFLTWLEAKRLEKAFAALEARLQGRAALLDSGFSAADICVGQAAWMGQHFVHRSAFAQVDRWLSALESRPAFGKALPPPGEGLYGREFYAPLYDPADEAATAPGRA